MTGRTAAAVQAGQEALREDAEVTAISTRERLDGLSHAALNHFAKQLRAGDEKGKTQAAREVLQAWGRVAGMKAPDPAPPPTRAERIANYRAALRDPDEDFLEAIAAEPDAVREIVRRLREKT